MPLSSISSSEAGSKPRILSGSWGDRIFHHIIIIIAKVRNKMEIKKEKGEKIENNVGMTIFIRKSLHLSEIVRIFAA